MPFRQIIDVSRSLIKGKGVGVGGRCFINFVGEGPNIIEEIGEVSGEARDWLQMVLDRGQELGEMKASSPFFAL